MAITHSFRIAGPLAPVVTPFLADHSVDVPRFIAHCRWLLDSGVGLAPFGTNSEAASLSMAERVQLLDALVDAKVDVSRLMPGTGVSALPETVALTRHAVQHGVAGVLMLPPFFYKNLSDDGLFAYYSEVIEKVGDSRLAVYLYHIPQMSQVPISLALVERLLKRYPKTVAGLKDSSGVWDNTLAVIQNFGAQGFAVFPASESRMPLAVELGGAGCISATCNVNPGRIRELYDAIGTSRLTDLQPSVDAVRKTFEAAPMIPAMKAMLARMNDHDGWRTVRPPLAPLTLAQELAIAKDLAEHGFPVSA